MFSIFVDQVWYPEIHFVKTLTQPQLNTTQSNSIKNGFAHPPTTLWKLSGSSITDPNFKDRFLAPSWTDVNWQRLSIPGISQLLKTQFWPNFLNLIFGDLMFLNWNVIWTKILFDSNFFGHEIIWTNIFYGQLILFGLKFFDRNFFQTQHFFELDFCGHQFF